MLKIVMFDMFLWLGIRFVLWMCWLFGIFIFVDDWVLVWIFLKFDVGNVCLVIEFSCVLLNWWIFKVVFVFRFYSLCCYGYDVLFVLWLYFFVIVGGDVCVIFVIGLLKMLNEFFGVLCDFLSDFNWVGSCLGMGVVFLIYWVI